MTSQANSKTTLASTVADDIRKRIVAGDFLPEQKLHVQRLAETFGVTISPVREALNRLSSEGLVQVRDMRGFWVCSANAEELSEISRTRTWLSDLALRESMAHGGKVWEESVVLAHHRLIKQPRLLPDDTGPNRAWEDAHRAFHMSLTTGCKSRYLVTYCDQLFTMADRYRHLARSSPRADAKRRDGEHRRIVEAVVGRRADEAVELLIAHFETTSALCQAMLRRKSRKSGGAE
jgi:GntR family transcriptional regulator, carbon starvation induced regulator